MKEVERYEKVSLYHMSYVLQRFVEISQVWPKFQKECAGWDGPCINPARRTPPF